jgi:hypothetical protein
MKNNNQPIKLVKKNKNPKKTETNSGFNVEEIHGQMPVFNCSCGVKILIVSDLLEMNKAIKNHIIEHEKLSGQILTEDDLRQEILSVIIETINKI